MRTNIFSDLTQIILRSVVARTKKYLARVEDVYLLLNKLWHLYSVSYILIKKQQK
jgi:hypothetical protein